MSNENRLWLLLPLETYYEGYCYDEGIGKLCDLSSQTTTPIVLLDIVNHDFEEIEENGTKLIKLVVTRRNKNRESQQKIVENCIYLGVEQYNSLLSPSSHRVDNEAKIDYWMLNEGYDDKTLGAIESLKGRKAKEAQSITDTLKQILVHEPFSS